ncbi:MAG: tetratricopeptide repeat protein [Acidobacteria bacterium]|nr:tetratricopeptide repeat protein [Acidobacteriota bacterium]
MFPDERQKEGLAFELVNAGAFHAMATATPEQCGAVISRFLPRPEMGKFNGWRLGLTGWANALSQRKHQVNRSADEEAEQGHLKPGRFRRPEPARALEEVIQVIDRQKTVIRQVLAQGDLDRAREFATDLVGYQRRNSKPIHIAKSLCDLAQSAKQLGHHGIQLEWAQQAVDLVPDDGWSLVQLGDAFLLNRNWEAALRNFDLGRMHGQVEVARNGRAEVLKSLGQLEESLKEYTATVRDFPHDVVARTGRAEVLKSLGQLEESLKEYTATVRDFPQNVVARNGRAEVLKSLGQLEESLKEYTATVRDFPQNVVARNGRAEVLKSLGQLEESLKEYTATVRDFPHDVVARTGASCVCLAQGNWDKALAWLGTPAEARPVNWVGMHVQAMIYLKMERAAEAMAILERGAAHSPMENRRYFKSGLAYARLLARQFQQAAQALAQETTPAARVLQMHIYTELNDMAKVREAFEAANRLTREPRVVELTTELAARAKLSGQKSARSDQWVFNRELELLLAA